MIAKRRKKGLVIAALYASIIITFPTCVYLFYNAAKKLNYARPTALQPPIVQILPEFALITSIKCHGRDDQSNFINVALYIAENVASTASIWLDGTAPFHPIGNKILFAPEVCYLEHAIRVPAARVPISLTGGHFDLMNSKEPAFDIRTRSKKETR